MIGQPFIPDWSQLRVFAPELWLIGGIIAVLLAPFFTQKSNRICGAIALLALVAALVSSWTSHSAGGYFRNMLLVDGVSVYWRQLLLLFSIGIVWMWFSSSASSMHEGDGPEFFTLLLAAICGLSLMGATANLLMLVMAVELASLPSYILAGFRKTQRLGAEASLKYVLFGAVCSATMIYGLSILYGIYGTFNLPELAGQMSRVSAPPLLLVVALTGVLAGLGFKISAVPFHFWCPDVFEGAAIEITAFLSVASKGAALVLLLRVLAYFAQAGGYHSVPGIPLNAIAILIGVLGAITATVGNTAAFAQTNIKRLLAYSSIAHAGYMLCGLSLLVSLQAPVSTGGFSIAAQVLLLYLSVYLFMNLGAFAVAAQVSKATGGETLSDFAGLGRRNPVLAICMAGCLFSLVGLPPMAGFAAKLNLLIALIHNGGWQWALVAVIAINTVLSLYYYARVIRAMYLEDSQLPAFSASPLGKALAGGCAIMLVVMLIGFNPLTRLVNRHSWFEFSSAPATSDITALK